MADESRIATRYMDGRRASYDGIEASQVGQHPGGWTVKRRPLDQGRWRRRGHGLSTRIEDRFEMNNELEEPMRIVQLGRTGLYIEPDQAGSYLLHGSDGTVIAAPFTRDDAARFARELLRWVQEADPQA
jgi:hypothetical protein